MTTIVVALCGLYIVSIGALGVASPPRLISAVSRLQSQRGLYIVAAIRIALGSSLLLAAPSSRAPSFLFIFGVLVLVAGLVTPFFWVQHSEATLDWWSRQTSLIRAWCLVLLALGLGVLWSVLS